MTDGFTRKIRAPNRGCFRGGGGNGTEPAPRYAGKSGYFQEPKSIQVVQANS